VLFHFNVNLTGNLTEISATEELIRKLLYVNHYSHHHSNIWSKYIAGQERARENQSYQPCVNPRELFNFAHSDCVRKEQSAVLFTTLKRASGPNELFRIAIEKKSNRKRLNKNELTKE